MQFELVKIVGQTVIAVRDGDRIINEIGGEQIPCYSPEQLNALWQQAESEVAQRNEQEAANAGNGNRQQRRSRKKVQPQVPEEV